MINGYKLFCQDRNCYGGDILLYFNENIPPKTANVEGIEKDCEILTNKNNLFKNSNVIQVGISDYHS